MPRQLAWTAGCLLCQCVVTKFSTQQPSCSRVNIGPAHVVQVLWHREPVSHILGDTVRVRPRGELLGSTLLAEFELMSFLSLPRADIPSGWRVASRKTLHKVM